MDPFIFIGTAVGLYVLSRLKPGPDPRLKKIELAPRVAIASARDGKIQRVAGKLQLAGEPLVAPLSGRRCAYYEVTVEEVEGAVWDSARSNRYFEHDSSDFFISDDSGKALVRQGVPNVILDIDIERERRVFNAPPPELDALLDRLAALPTPRIYRDRSRIVAREGILGPGEVINVYGLCGYESASVAPSYRESDRLLVVRPPPEGGEMLVTDYVLKD